MIKFTKKILQ